MFWRDLRQGLSVLQNDRLFLLAKETDNELLPAGMENKESGRKRKKSFENG